jgi:hypothetical protein
METPVSPAQLRQLLNYCFDTYEFRDLCLDLGVDYDALPGEGKDSKSRELIAYFGRPGRSIDKLIEVCSQLRPKAPWNTVTAKYEPYAPDKVAELRQKLTDQFDEDELRNISASVRVNYKRLGGAEQGSIARELTLYLARRERLAELIEACAQRRPNVSW